MKAFMIAILIMVGGVILWQNFGEDMTATIGDGLRTAADIIDHRNPLERFIDQQSQPSE